MARQRHLKNAPITEAIIDLQFDPPQGSSKIDPNRLAGLTKSLKDSHPNREELFMGEFQFQTSAKARIKKTSSQHRRIGYRFSDEQRREVIQFRVNGFTFSRLKPYEDWQHLTDGAARFWKLSNRLTSHGPINRVALRFINHLEIPMGKNIDDYLTIGPKVPPRIPGLTVNTFLHRTLIEHKELSAHAMVTVARDETIPAQSGMARILFDIDVFKRGEFDEESIWRTLEGFRDLKNKIFFYSITERMIKDYQ